MQSSLSMTSNKAFVLILRQIGQLLRRGAGPCNVPFSFSTRMVPPNPHVQQFRHKGCVSRYNDWICVFASGGLFCNFPDLTAFPTFVPTWGRSLIPPLSCRFMASVHLRQMLSEGRTRSRGGLLSTMIMMLHRRSAPGTLLQATVGSSARLRRKLASVGHTILITAVRHGPYQAGERRPASLDASTISPFPRPSRTLNGWSWEVADSRAGSRSHSCAGVVPFLWGG